MALYAGYFLASIVAFLFGSVSAFDALRVNNQKSGVRAATMVLPDFAN
jgi:hypothetical protein